MPFDDKDITQAENLLRALKKARFNLEGLEVLSMAEVMKWVAAKLNPEIRFQVEVSKKKAELSQAVIGSKKSPKKKQGGK